MIGGMVTSTILTLIVIPVLFALVRGPELCGALAGRRGAGSHGMNFGDELSTNGANMDFLAAAACSCEV